MSEDQKPDDEVVQETNVTLSDPPVTEEPEAPSADDEDVDEEFYDDEEPEGPSLLTRAWQWYVAHKKITLPLTAVIILIAVFAVPTTRYGVLGLVIKKNVQVLVVDNKTGVPVSEVEVRIRGKVAKTNGEGWASLEGVPVGSGAVQATKKYYSDNSKQVLVGLRTKPIELKVDATGRQVLVYVTNKITGSSISGVSIKAADTEVITDKNGEATLVLPADQQSAEATLQKEGFNEVKLPIKVTRPTIQDNRLDMVPVGSVYFLSKLSGKIDVVKTDLDGKNRNTVVEGTGNEEDGGTTLLASRDWKYLALHARRDTTKPKLYLIKTDSDELLEIDSGDATFSPIGWSDHNFVYTVQRHDMQPWQPKATALKTYKADALQLQTIDETGAEGSNYNDFVSESLTNVLLLKSGVTYTKNWYASPNSAYRLANKRMAIYIANPSTGNKQQLKDFNAGNNGYFHVSQVAADKAYFGVFGPVESFYEYSSGALNETRTFGAEALSSSYPNHLLSPSGNTVFWHEVRDGRNSFFIGSVEARNGKQIGHMAEYVPYGWYTDEYILVSKNGSELYVQPVSGTGNGGQLVKISDYHKPTYRFHGYGGY